MTLVSASIAHELRTPLASLKSAAQGIKQQLSPLIASYQTAVTHQLEVPKRSALNWKGLPQIYDINLVNPSFNEIETLIGQAAKDNLIKSSELLRDSKLKGILLQRKA